MVDVHICFVCTGNICRSPMAAIIFRRHLHHAGLDDRVRVTSAGIGPWHVGEPADRRAAKVLAEHGYSTEHIAAQVDDDHLSADLVVAMDAEHLSFVRTDHGGPDRVRMLRSFDPESGTFSEVPDPYGGGAHGFTNTLSMIEASMPGLIDWVRERV